MKYTYWYAMKPNQTNLCQINQVLSFLQDISNIFTNLSSAGI